jgi:hypothetical protein
MEAGIAKGVWTLKDLLAPLKENHDAEVGI